MRVAGVLRRLASGTYTVTRFSSGSYGTDAEDGRYRPGATHCFRVRASIQPLVGEELLRLPEGERTRERIVIFTVSQLKTIGQSDTASADRVEYRGKQFEVESVEIWNEHYRYFRCIAAKVEE